MLHVNRQTNEQTDKGGVVWDLRVLWVCLVTRGMCVWHEAAAGLKGA
jgi:hypothetical protein